jgi:hypothetical protein
LPNWESGNIVSPLLTFVSALLELSGLGADGEAPSAKITSLG